MPFNSCLQTLLTNRHNIYSVKKEYHICENEIISMPRAWDKEKTLSPQQDSNL